MVFFLNRIDFYSIEIIGRVLTRKRRKEGRKEGKSIDVNVDAFVFYLPRLMV